MPKPKLQVKSRDLKPTKCLAMSTFLKEVDIKSLIAMETTIDGKTKMLESIINFGLDLLIAITTKTIYSSEPPWMSKSLKQAICRRQKALAQGNISVFKTLRNRVNREQKLCRAKFYESKVDHLKECSPSIWWKEVKLSGLASPVTHREDSMCLLQNVECNNDQIPTTPYDLANIINQTFLEPMKAFDPLRSNFINRGTVENQSLCTSEFCVFKLLANLNLTSGPDGIPAWILQETLILWAHQFQKF